MSRPAWAAVIPVKGANGKSRLTVQEALRARLAIAFALDTVAAAASARTVAEVVVVTGEAEAPLFRGVRVVTDPGRGLNCALQAGLAATGNRRLGRVLLLGDLPALTSAELDAALRAASGVPRALVPDRSTGSALTTARAGVQHRPRFGAGSRAAHRAAGYRELAIPLWWGLRGDVDTLDDLDALRAAAGRGRAGPRLGRATAEVLRTP